MDVDSSDCYEHKSFVIMREHSRKLWGGGRVLVGLAVFKTVAWHCRVSRVGSTPIRLRRSYRS